MARSKRATFWERLWASTIVLYTFAATFVVWKTLSKYGVNPIGFFFIDLVTSWLYGISTARLVVSLYHRQPKPAQKYAIYSVLNFAIPYSYILIFARHTPRDVYYVIFGAIAVLALFSIAGVVQQIRTYRREQLEGK